MQKTNFKTRLLALLTAVFMVVMCMPFAAFAASTDPAAREKIVVSFTKDNKTENVVLVKVIADRNLMLVKGAVPGKKGGVVRIRPAIKGQDK